MLYRHITSHDRVRTVGILGSTPIEQFMDDSVRVKDDSGFAECRDVYDVT